MSHRLGLGWHMLLHTHLSQRRLTQSVSHPETALSSLHHRRRAGVLCRHSSRIYRRSLDCPSRGGGRIVRTQTESRRRGAILLCICSHLPAHASSCSAQLKALLHQSIFGSASHSQIKLDPATAHAPRARVIPVSLWLASARSRDARTWTNHNQAWPSGTARDALADLESRGAVQDAGISRGCKGNYCRPGAGPQQSSRSASSRAVYLPGGLDHSPTH